MAYVIPGPNGFEGLPEIHHALTAGQISHYSLADSVAPAAEVAPSSDDKSGFMSHNQDMNDITRQEIEAKLSASEARMDARVVSIEGKIDAFLAAQAERDKATDYRIQRIESDTASIKADVKEISSQVQSIRITMAKYLGASIVIGAIASAAVGALIRFVLTTPAA